MGVFETLATVCPPEDLAKIRDGMREFLSTAGAGAESNRGRLQLIAERLSPFERRYLPAIHKSQGELIPCDTLVSTVGPNKQLALLVALVLAPRKMFLLHGPEDETTAGQMGRYLENGGIRVVARSIRPQDIHEELERLRERLKREDSEHLVFLPGEGPPGVSVGLTALAQRLGVPVVYTEVETYAGVPRPFSLRIRRADETGKPARPPARPLAGEPSAPAPGHLEEEPAVEIEIELPSAPPPRPAPPTAPPPRPAPPAASPPREPPPSAPPPPAAAPTPPPVAPAPAPLVGVVPAVDLVTRCIESFNLRLYMGALHSASYIATLPDASRILWLPGDLFLELVRLYADWDRFAHSPVDDQPDRRLHDRLLAVWQRLGPARGKLVSDAEVSRNVAFLRTLQASWQPGGRILGDAGRIVDFYSAGLRRQARGAHDEAAACFLRGIELSAVLVLQGEPFRLGDPQSPDYGALVPMFGSHGEMTDRVNTLLRAWGQKDTLPPRDAPLGLRHMMTLLEAAGEQRRDGPALAIGSRFRELFTRASKEQPESLAAALARSIFCGGTSPLGEDACMRLEQAARDTISRSVGVDLYRKLLSAALHPELSVPA